MKLDKLTCQIFSALTGVAIVVGGVGTALLVNQAGRNYIEIQAAASRQQAVRVAAILERQLADGVPKNQVIHRLQESLIQSPFDRAGFLCLMGANGKVLCHPDPQEVGMTMEMPRLEAIPRAQRLAPAGNPVSNRVEMGLLRHQTYGGSTHLVYLQPVTGTGWTVAVHANFDLVRQRISLLRRTILLFALPILAGIIISGTWVARLVEQRYERRLEELNAELEQRVANRTAELRQAQKLEAVGQLAGGIAHDFNNLLCAISGYATLADEGLPVGSPAQQHLAEVLKAARRAGDLTAHLLAFSRKQQLEPRITDLNHIITDIIGMLRRIIGERVQIRTALDPGLAPILADRSQIEQVVLNLAVNARDAMPEGGTLTIGTRNGPSGDTERRQPRSSGRPRAVVLTVTDTGVGIPDELKDRIFEPFFTTKEKGSGTGLGLAVVHGIVKQHGGEIEFESCVGRGTTFRIWLPAPSDGAHPHEDTGSEAPARGTETLLVVEDDRAVRTLAVSMLQQLGYRVLSAESADTALSLLADGGQAVSMVLTDMVMPGLDVRAFAERLAKSQPRLKVAYMTGYSDEAGFLQMLTRRGASVLHKPFTLASLSQAVRLTLDGAPPKMVAPDSARSAGSQRENRSAEGGRRREEG